MSTTDKYIEKLEELVEFLKTPISGWDYFYFKTLERLESEINALKAETSYHLNCDSCGELFWSKEAFPKPQLCEKCKEQSQEGEQQPEVILCAAIWYKDLKVKEVITSNILPVNCDKGLVFSGFRHGHCMHTMTSITGLRSAKPEVGEYVQGFITNKNRFVNRQEAYSIAFKANQIIGPNKGHETNLVGLTSEDIY